MSPFLAQILEALPEVALTFGGAVFGYYWSRRSEHHKQRIANTFEMCRQFEGDEMIKARCEADKRFIPRDGSPPENIRRQYLEREVEYTMPILQVIHFYNYLHVMHRNKQVDSALAISIFSEVYRGWHVNYFKHQVEFLKDAHPSWAAWIPDLPWLLGAAPSPEPGQWSFDLIRGLVRPGAMPAPTAPSAAPAFAQTHQSGEGRTSLAPSPPPDVRGAR